MRKLIIIVMVLAMCFTAHGKVNINEINFSNVTANTFDRSLRGWIDTLNTDITNASGLSNIGTGKVFYVDSAAGGSASSTGTTLATAAPTLDAGINLCTANRGDVIFVLQDHSETLAAANGFDADIAGITIVHLGNGDNQGTYLYSATGSTAAIGAANVTIIGGRFAAGISEVVAGIIVEAAGTSFTMIGSQFPEPTTSSWEFNIAIQLTTASDDATFLGCTAYSASATGADHWLNGGAGVVNRLTVTGCKIHGEYAISPIFSDQVDLGVYIQGNDITQLTASQFAIEFTAAATGIVSDNRINSTVLFEVDPGSMSYWQNMEGDALPEGVSLTGQLGAFTGPAAGAAQDDNVKASLDLINTDTALILANQAGTTTIAGHSYATVMTATSDTDDLFDVDGGAILITSFVGVVTTQVGAVANGLDIILDADAGWIDSDFSTSVELNGDIVGTRYTFTNAAESVLVPVSDTAGNTSLMNAWYSGEGMIEQRNGGGGTTGAIKWYMTWIPYADGTTVTAQ